MNKNYKTSLVAGIALGCAAMANAQTINTIAGTGIFGYDGDGVAIAQKLYFPCGVTLDKAGNVIIADQSNNLIRKITPSGNLVTIGGIYGVVAYYGDEKPALSTTYNSPFQMSTDNAGNIYVADGNNHMVRKIDPSGVSHNVAGYGSGYSGDGGPATAADLYYPAGVAVDDHDNVYIGDYGNGKIRKVDGVTGIITTYASIPQPNCVATDHFGNVYVSSWSSKCVYKIDPSGVPSILWSNPGISALNNMNSVATDAIGNVYFGDALYIRRIDPRTGHVDTVAGNGTIAYAGDGGPATNASLNNIDGLWVGNDGTIYIGDAANHRIRAITYPITPIAAITGTTNICVTVTTALSNATIGGIWLSSNPAVATVNGTTGVATGISSGTATITYATLRNQATTVIKVDAPIGIDNAGKVLGLNHGCPGTTVILTESVGGGVWTSGNTAVSTINSAGLVHAVHPGSTILTYTLNGQCGSSAMVKFPFTTLTYDECTGAINTGAASVTNVSTAINAWPNPNDGTFSVNMESPDNEQVNVTITNVVGQKIKEYITATNQPSTVRLEGAGGVYFINAISEHGKWSQKVVVNSAR